MKINTELHDQINANYTSQLKVTVDKPTEKDERLKGLKTGDEELIRQELRGAYNKCKNGGGGGELKSALASIFLINKDVDIQWRR